MMLEEIRDLERGGGLVAQGEDTALGNRPGFGRALGEISASIKKIFKRYVGVELTTDQRNKINSAIGRILVFGEATDDDELAEGRELTDDAKKNLAGASAVFENIAKDAKKGAQLAKQGNVSLAVHQMREVIDRVRLVMPFLELAADVSSDDFDDYKIVTQLERVGADISDLGRHIKKRGM